MLIKSKKLTLAVLISSFLVALSTTIYYKNTCFTGGCSHRLIVDVISPVELAGYVIGFFALVFLALPPKYFNLWFKYIFSWGFPISVVLVNVLSSETNWLVISKTDIVRLMGMVFGVITIIFIGFIWWRSRKNK